MSFVLNTLKRHPTIRDNFFIRININDTSSKTKHTAYISRKQHDRTEYVDFEIPHTILEFAEALGLFFEPKHGVNRVEEPLESKHLFSKNNIRLYAPEMVNYAKHDAQKYFVPGQIRIEDTHIYFFDNPQVVYNMNERYIMFQEDFLYGKLHLHTYTKLLTLDKIKFAKNSKIQKKIIDNLISESKLYREVNYTSSRLPKNTPYNKLSKTVLRAPDDINDLIKFYDIIPQDWSTYLNRNDKNL